MSIRGGRTVRGTSNRNDRGSAATRRRRKWWLLETFGDGVKAPCYRCEVMLDFVTLTVDRITPGCRGGRYVRGNIRPACGRCNSETGGAVRSCPSAPAGSAVGARSRRSGGQGPARRVQVLTGALSGG
jgi:hypothetical protein